MYFSTQTFTLTCPEGETGGSFTATGSETSIISQRDAEVKALAFAMALAYEMLQCSFLPGPSPIIYYSILKTASASAQAGYQTQTFTVTLPAGSIYSLVSQTAANNGAQSAAQAQANQLRDLRQKPIYHSASVVWSGACMNAVAYSVTVTLPAGYATSNISQSDATQTALAAAKAQIQALLVTHCTITYYSTQQSFTANCVMPNIGPSVTITNPPGFSTSIVSQADANAISLAAATATATALLQCSSGNFTNVFQSYTAVCQVIYGNGWVGTPVTMTSPAGSFFSSVSQADADNKALNNATERAIAALSCHWSGSGPPP